VAERRVVRLTVNGESAERLVEPRKTLADFIRQDLELTGTHIGCEHGVCGACTVLLDGKPVRSCLLFAVQVDGAEVRTVEWLARAGELHPIQAAFHDRFALQCGYCTPGILMTVYDLLRRSPSPSREEIRRELAGNICRCTGYQAIVDAVEDAATRLRESPP
jgi:aerobic carbon-monoxide dehydrogenase small subunit